MRTYADFMHFIFLNYVNSMTFIYSNNIKSIDVDL